jgi:hypothetical protein
MHENKESHDELPENYADILDHWTTLERHFSPSMREDFPNSGTK